MIQPPNIKRTRRILAIVTTAVMLLLVGAAASLYAAQHDMTARPAPPPASFPTPEAVNNYLGQWGLACVRYNPLTPTAGQLAAGSCATAGQPIAIGIYADRAGVTHQWDEQAPVVKGIIDFHMVLGENYTITGPAAWTADVAQTLHAEYRAQPM